MARRTYDEMQMAATIASVHSDACRDPVEDIRNAAFNEYQRVKKHKQGELHARRNSNSNSNVNTNTNAITITLTKQQKKKDDNHASAVASRSKQEFLLKEFEDALLKKIQQANLLALGYSDAQAKVEHMKKRLAQRDAALHLLNQELAMYRNKNINATKDEGVPVPVPVPVEFDGINSINSININTINNSNHPADLAATMDEIISTQAPFAHAINPHMPTTSTALPANISPSTVQVQVAHTNTIPSHITSSTVQVQNKLADHNPHLLVSHWGSRTVEELGMSNNLNPAA